MALADGSKTKVDEIVKDIHVTIPKISFPANMTVMKMRDYEDFLLLVGRSFLAKDEALIDVDKGEIMIRSKGEYQSYINCCCQE